MSGLPHNELKVCLAMPDSDGGWNITVHDREGRVLRYPLTVKRCLVLLKTLADAAGELEKRGTSQGEPGGWPRDLTGYSGPFLGDLPAGSRRLGE